MKKILAILTAALLLGSCSSIRQAEERISVDLRSPRFPAGFAEAQFDKFFFLGGLSKGDITVTYYPADDAVCLQFRHDFTTFYQFWSRTSREAFTAALAQYKEDYEQRKLTKSNMKTKRVYGTVRGFVIWETSRFSIQGRSFPNMEIGYYFKEGSPFFSITQREAENESDQSTDGNKTSSNQVLYFTRLQAESLAVLFDQEYLRGLGTGGAGKVEIEADAY